jgi:transposase
LTLSNDISVFKDLVLTLLSRVETLETENALLRTENAALKTENADLRSQLQQNSGNSHKPPSSDGLKKKPALPSHSGKKSGGQVGHKGTTLEMVSAPDSVIVHHSPRCACCCRPFSLDEVEGIAQKRQVFDIPVPRMVVTEHQIGVITCCGQAQKGLFPDSVSHPVQYGSKIKALSVMLNNEYKLPIEKIEQLFGDIYACHFNESTVLSANATCSEALVETEQTIKSAILASPVVHFDETGMRVAGCLQWFHVASTRLFTYLFVDGKRGKQALESTASLIKDFKNWAIHDCWQSYFDFKNVKHGLCNAHILRELQALIENGSVWAKQMHQLLLQMFKDSEKGTQILPNKEQWVEKYQLICKNADEQEPPPIKGNRGKPKNSKGRNLLNRLTEHQDGIIAFAFNELIPFTNNQAERDIRCLKTKQKVATSFRTLKGAQEYARIQSFISTTRKHKINVFENLIRIFDKKPVHFVHD